MKKNLLLLATLCTIGTVRAQENNGVSIGIPLPDSSAILHVDSTNKGILIPNVVLTDLNLKSPIATEAKESLLVYNNQEKIDAGKVVIAKGYYYWVPTGVGTGKWVRVITSEDANEILAGQIQESFVEETKEENGVPVGTGIFVYNPDKTKADDAVAVGRIKLDIPELVKKNQTLTALTVGQFDVYFYSDGKTYDHKLTADEEALAGGIVFVEKKTEIELIYTDEKGVLNKFSVRDLLGANDTNVLAITDLKTKEDHTGLVYTNDKGKDVSVDQSEVVKRLETETKLDISPDYVLTYVNEGGGAKTFNYQLRNIVKEPWLVAGSGQEATKNNENVFINGWVGIGLNAADAAAAVGSLKPDEKLRINGSIYARNSYYADYVFENYFTNESSSLKYDYNFKDLSAVESFIKTNRHLPGITPISQLDTSSEGGYLINVSELSVQLLEKVEELYLHTIEQKKVIDQQKELLTNQAQKLESQDKRLDDIEHMLKGSSKK